jgi:hypothetical protein
MSLIFETQFTAIATLVLAVFAYIVAILAHAAWRKQSSEVRDRAELRRSPSIRPVRDCCSWQHHGRGCSRICENPFRTRDSLVSRPDWRCTISQPMSPLRSSRSPGSSPKQRCPYRQSPPTFPADSWLSPLVASIAAVE